MKKAIFILLVCLIIVSCQRSYELNDEVEYYVVEYEYNGHDYILFDTMNGGLGVIHNPDCKCVKKQSN
jgi:hypothetical protein